MKINKKILRFFIIALLVLSIWLIICNNAFSYQDVDEQLKKFESVKQDRAGNKVRNVMGATINIITTVGMGISIIMLVVIGIRYVSKGAEGKAEAKKDLTGYMIGAVLIFGVSGVLKIFQMFVGENVNNIEGL